MTGRGTGNTTLTARRVSLAVRFISVIVLFMTLLTVSARTVFPRGFRNEVESTCREFGLGQAEVYAVIKAESNFRAKAVSNAGACGAMQLMPSTARYCANMLGEDFDDNDIFQPGTNIRLGCFYLSYLYREFDGDNVYAAYNAGEYRVRQWLNNGGDILYEETATYVKRVTAYKKIYSLLYGI